MTKKSERSPLQNQRKAETMLLIFEPLELSVKSSKESIETVSLLKTWNKVVEDTVK
jgi:hypothetical protein